MAIPMDIDQLADRELIDRVVSLLPKTFEAERVGDSLGFRGPCKRTPPLPQELVWATDSPTPTSWLYEVIEEHEFSWTLEVAPCDYPFGSNIFSRRKCRMTVGNGERRQVFEGPYMNRLLFEALVWVLEEPA